ncbi:MAG: PDZ domain-containing protein [Pirellula sp.]
MKKYMFKAPVWCMATMALLTPSLRAQEEAKEEKQTKKSSAIVVTATGDDAKDIEKKVIEALEKAGVTKEVKLKVLAQLEKNSVKLNAQAKLQDHAEAIENIKNQAEAFKEHANRMTIQMSELPATLDTGEMMTRVMRVVGDQKYRIGVQTTVTTTEGEEPEPGVRIEAVFPDTPASEAGIKEGDVVLEINGEDLKTVDQLTKTIQVAGKEGKEITLQIKRDDESMEIKVKPSEIKEMDKIVENIQLLRAPQSGWVFEAMGNPGEMSIFGASADSFDLKKELEEIRNEIKEIKEMLKELKK